MTDDVKRVKAGEVIYREGEDADFLYIIKKGAVRLLKVSEQRMIVVANLGAKGVFGSEDVFKRSLYSNNAVALEDTELVGVSGSDVYSQLKTMPNWIDKILAMLSGRLADTEDILVQHKIYQSSLNEEFVIDEKLEAQIKEAICGVE